MNEIAPQVAGSLFQPSKFVSTEVEKDMSKGFRFLPRVQVSAGTSKVCLEGKVPIGILYLTEGKEVVDWGKKAVGLILGWRPKAMRFSPDLVHCYNPQSTLFQEIRAKAEQGGQNNPNNFGPEFLVWFTEHQKLATFFFGSTSMRNEAGIGIGIFKKQQDEKRIIPVIFEIQLLGPNKDNKRWNVAQISEYESDIPENQMPNFDEIGKELDKFNNPPEDAQKEKAEETSTSDRD